MASFNELLERGTKTIGEIADDVMNSNIYKNVIPGKEAWAKEFYNTVNSNEKIKASILNGRIGQSFEDKLAGLNVDKDIARQMTSQIQKSGYSDKGFESASKILQKNGKDKDTADKIISVMKKQSSKALNEAIDTDNLSLLQKAPSYARAYFSNPDKKVVNDRIVAAVGAYSALSVGGRYLSGGTLTSDNYGQRDIAGIPFI